MSWFEGLEHIVREQEPLAAWNWLRIGGSAEFFAEPTSVEELKEILKRTHAANLPVWMLGSGSNILVRDQGVQGVVIQLSAPAFCEIRSSGNEIVCGGGAKLNHVVSTAARDGLGGMEALVGIPGTIGGALKRNAIGHGAAIGQWTESITAITPAGEELSLGKEELRFGYRESNLDDLVILHATFRLDPSDTAKVTRQMQKLWIMKRSTQPTGELGHGQAFANPRGMTAGEIIEQAGLRSESVGNAQICERNANFIEARAGASSSDVLALIEQVRTKVSETLGVELVPGMEIW